MKMTHIKTKTVLVVALLGLLAPISVQGQFLKKLKKNVEDKVVKKASEKTDELLNGSEEKTTTPQVENPTSNPPSEKKTIQGNNPVSTSKKQGPEVNATDILTYKAPSKDFIDVVIQSHKGLPRYGDLYFLRGTTARTNNKAYEALLELKLLKETFKDMDQTKLTKHGSSDLAEKNSQFAQFHLLTLAREVFTDEKLQEYFCDPEAKAPCNFYNTAGDRGHVSHWGGTGKNEFAQNRSYTGFIKNYYGALQEWSETFYKDGSEIAYYVVRAAVADKYDFKNKGYWIGNIFGIGGDFILHYSNFLAYTENEKALKHQSKKAFLAVDSNKAKEFNLQSRSPVFVVFKVRVTPSVQSPTHVAWEFELEDSKIEVYKNPALTNKIGEMDMKTVMLKY